MEEFIRILLKLSMVLSVIVSVLLIGGGAILFFRPGILFSLTRLIGLILCILGVGIAVCLIFSYILPRK